ncbi:MAG TPA: HNH endonuclease, partial [Bacillota bacterium]
MREPRERYCDTHRQQRKREQSRDYDRRRGTRQERGYDANWLKLRRIILAREPLCRPCREQGRVTPAEHVHHIVPLRAGGTNDESNLMPVCQACHNRLTAEERKQVIPTPSGTRPAVTIVCGPPGAGKTEYVRQRAAWGDLIVDLDALYMALSGLPMYEKPEALLPFVAEARDAILKRLQRPSEVRRAWVIGSYPKRRERQELARRLQADVVVLAAPPLECYRRIQSDPRRSSKAELWYELVQKWWRE